MGLCPRLELSHFKRWEWNCNELVIGLVTIEVKEIFIRISPLFENGHSAGRTAFVLDVLRMNGSAGTSHVTSGTFRHMKRSCFDSSPLPLLLFPRIPALGDESISITVNVFSFRSPAPVTCNSAAKTEGEV